jgi:chromosome segregation ATPase
LEVERLKRENSRAEAALAELEKEKKEAVDAKIETETKLAETQEELTTLRGSQSGPGKLKPKPLEVRLNDYAGKLAHLEGVFDNERKEKSKLETSLRQEKQRTEELESRVQILEREKSHVEDETVRNLQQQKSEVERCLQEKERELVEAAVRHQEELDRLRAETAVQKQNYEKKIDEKEAALRGKERELEMVQQSLQRGHSEKEGEVTELRTNLRRTSSQLQQKESEIVQIRSELQSQLLTLATEKENLRANESQIASRIRDTLQENDRLKNELTKTQKVTGEFRKECESLVGDYQTAAKKIELLEKERDRFRNQTDMGMRELAMRAERIKALEAERQSLQDQLQHMDLQLKQYMADFRSEREMRESAFQVKEMAERRQHELSSEVSTLQKQLTELQTVQHFDTDVSDDPGAVGGGGGGGRVWSGGRAIPTPRPASTDPSASPLAAPPLPPKPGGDFNFPRHQNILQQQPHHHHHQSQPQQYVGGGIQGLPPHHHGQELVTSATPFPQARPPPVSQPPVAMPTGMSPRQHSGGSPYPPNSRVDPVLMDPHRPPMGGGIPPPEPRFGPMPPVSAQQMGGPHGPGAMRPMGPAPVSAASQLRPTRTSEGQNWVAPGDVVNTNAPEVACPLCGRNDFATVTDLEIHCARCTGAAS